VIDRIRASEEEIQARVEARRAELAAETGLSGRPLADALAADLIESARWRAATIGATSALPFTIPILGFWGTLIFTVVGAAIWQLAVEVELVYALGFAYGVRKEPGHMRMVAFWLVQLTNFDDLRGRALTIGVRLTTRKLVEKLIAVGLTRAFEATAHSVAMARMMGRVPAEPWFVRATQYLGVPVLFFFGWKSVTGVGSRATSYFLEEAGLTVIEGGRG
jgi:hypothetical protein